MTAVDNLISNLQQNDTSQSLQPIVSTVELFVAALQELQSGVSPVVTPQNANTVFAGPANGAAAIPTFRTLVAADIPSTLSGQILTQGISGSSPGWYAQIIGDTTPRVRVGMNVSDVASIAFGSGSGARDVFLERVDAANLRFGGGDNAAPVAQTFSVQNVITGTTNTVGTIFTHSDSGGTGTGVSGGYSWQLHPPGLTGNTPNAALNAMLLQNHAANIPNFVLRSPLFSGGTGTSTVPYCLLSPSTATPATTWSTSGTFLGINSTSTFSGNFIDFHKNGGVSLFSVDMNGQVSSNNSILIASTAAFYWGTRSVIRSPADGVIKISNQNETDFNRLQFGGTTNLFPSLKRNTTSIQVRLADDSADSGLLAATLTVSNGANLIISTAAFVNGAAAGAGTLLNAPVAGNPTKWIPINDNGTTRYIPAW